MHELLSALSVLQKATLSQNLNEGSGFLFSYVIDADSSSSDETSGIMSHLNGLLLPVLSTYSFEDSFDVATWILSGTPSFTS
jgi:hypothetical protein